MSHTPEDFPLPEMPEVRIFGTSHTGCVFDVFSLDQMQAYARATLRAWVEAQKDPAKGMTSAQIDAAWKHLFSTENPYNPVSLKAFTKIVRWVEFRHLGIAP